MTDHPIPDDLVNKVGTVLALELGHTMLDPANGVPGPNTARIAREALHALASWADDVGATHIALDGWRRVKAEHVCDGDWDDDPDHIEGAFPFACNWTDGAGEMVAGAPLYTLTPDEVESEPSKAERHQAHYRTCGCLGDGSECCDPSCCPPEEAESGG